MPHSLVSLRAPAGLRAAVAATLLLLAGGMAHAQAQAPAARPAPRSAGSDASAIVAVVNGVATTPVCAVNRDEAEATRAPLPSVIATSAPPTINERAGWATSRR